MGRSSNHIIERLFPKPRICCRCAMATETAGAMGTGYNDITATMTDCPQPVVIPKVAGSRKKRLPGQVRIVCLDFGGHPVVDGVSASSAFNEKRQTGKPAPRDFFLRPRSSPLNLYF